MVTFDGDKLKAKLKERHMTQKELAEKIHVTESTISTYTNGTRNPTIPIYVKMLQALECDFSELLLFT